MHSKQNEIKNRALEVARYIIDTNATVRQAAKNFSISKSTVYKDVAERLWDYSPTLAEQVSMVLLKNKSERHLRGGFATREKYLNLKKSDTI